MTTPSFIEKYSLWTDDQKRRAEELKLFLEKDELQFVRLAWADPHGASRAKAVTVPTFLAALDERLQHQRRHHDARFRQRADVLVVHARRRHGPAGDDRLAQPHHRARSEDLSRAAVGARRRLDPVRRVFQFRRAVSFLAAASAAQAAAAPERARLEDGRRSRGRVVPDARRAERARRRQYRRARHPRRPDQDRADRARLFLSFRNQHGPDAAGAVGAGAGVRDARLAAALHGERVGAGAGGVHLRRARRARSRRRHAAVPHGHATARAPPRLLRHLHVPAGIEEPLFQRLASASVAGRREGSREPVHAGARGRVSCRRSA